MDLIEFLRARLDEDEADANQPPSDHAMHGADPVGTVNRECPDCRTPYAKKRMLAEVEAKRRIIELAQAGCTGDGEYQTCAEWPEHLLRCLALPYADHEDYVPEWHQI